MAFTIGLIIGVLGGAVLASRSEKIRDLINKRFDKKTQ